MPQNANPELTIAEDAFVAAITAALMRSGLTRDQAQAQVSFCITGAWNRLDGVINGLPIKIKKVNGNGHGHKKVAR
jgi:hypothetical protein